MAQDRQMVAQCPKCLTLETLWFNGDGLVPTTRFYQGKDGKVYHKCGSSEPCSLFTGSFEITNNTKPELKARAYKR